MAHMDVLLKEDVDNLGNRGQVVRVRSGYGRNYLLPQGLAIEATAGNKRMIEEQRRVLAKREERERASAQGESEKLDGLELRFERRVGEHGILYGSVTVLDIVEELKKLGYTVERRRVSLRDHIKEVGDYDVTIKLHRDVTPTIKVKVRKEGAEEAPVEQQAAVEEAQATAAEPAAEASSSAAEESAEATAGEPAAEPGASFVAADEAESAQE
ncbi:MAG TPA: 50S ribosomal protein L9 [Blastocatellia bacterium]|nr:50S ribosomal protein L9 [Blastocatellia bacterium]